jgi:hypothetical protein
MQTLDSPTSADKTPPKSNWLEGDAVRISSGKLPDRGLWDGFIDSDTTVEQALMTSPTKGKKAEFLAKSLDNVALYKALDGKPALAKEFGGEGMGDSKRRIPIGIHYHPFSFDTAIRMRELSSHHGACIDTVVAMAVGLGFDDESIYDILDPMTVEGFQQELLHMCEMLVTTGHGYLETCRGVDQATGAITGVYSQPANNMMLVQHGNRLKDTHFLYTPMAGIYLSGAQSFDSLHEDSQAVLARFGRVEEVVALSGQSVDTDLSLPMAFRDVGEVISFRRPTSMWSHYGGPSWIGANPYLELNRCHLARTHLYMQNRGAPDSILFLYGLRLSDDQKKALKETLDSTSGDSYGKSVALTFPTITQQTGKAHVERFGDQIDGTTFQEIHDTVALAICSAHRIPPILAGISTNRSLGNAGEMTQSLVVTQLTVINQIQHLIERTLKCTLGGPQGIPELKGKDFKLKKVTEVEDMASLNAFARQRQQDTSMTRATEKPELKR